MINSAYPFVRKLSLNFPEVSPRVYRRKLVIKFTFRHTRQFAKYSLNLSKEFALRDSDRELQFLHKLSTGKTLRMWKTRTDFRAGSLPFNVFLIRFL